MERNWKLGTKLEAHLERNSFLEALFKLYSRIFILNDSLSSLLLLFAFAFCPVLNFVTRKPEMENTRRKGKEVMAQFKFSGNWSKFISLIDVAEMDVRALHDYGILICDSVANQKNPSGFYGAEASSHAWGFKSERANIDKGKKPMCLAPRKSLKKKLMKNGTKMLRSNTSKREAETLPLRKKQMPMEMNWRVLELAGGEANITWVDHKKLFATDLSLRHSRLSLPKKVMELLTEEERLQLTRRSNPGSIDVMVLDPMVRVWQHLQFKFWTSSMQPVLIQGWLDIAYLNGFEVEDTLLIWIFRMGVQNELCFAFDVQRP